MGSEAVAPLDRVRLFTDGACSGNPGPGGWAFILKHPATGQMKESSGAEFETTNNRMELNGVIEGLSTLKRACDVEIITDSQYVAKGITQWMANWKRQGWQRKEAGKRSQAQLRCERRPLAKNRLIGERPQGPRYSRFGA